MHTPKEIIERLRSRRELPTPPGVALQLLELLRNPNTSAADVANTLGCDPVLTSRILTYANSPLVGSSAVASLSRGVALLGMRRVAVLALSYCFVDSKQGKKCPAFNCEQFWQESIARAVICRRAAQLVAPHESEEAFVEGLVSNMGGLLLAAALPTEYDALLQESKNRIDRTELEREQLGVTADELGLALLKEWHFPGPFIDDVRESLLIRDGQNPATERMLPRCLSIAHLAAEAMVRPTDTLDMSLLDRTVDQVGRCLGLDHEAWEVTFDACIREWKTQCEVLDISSHEVKSFVDIENEVRNQLAMLSIAAVTESEQMFRRATTDALTGIHNRSSFDDRLDLEVERFRRNGGDLLLLIVDVDHFKSFNDTYGHLVGDKVLCGVASTLENNVRRVDLACRYGGEEFAIIAPQCNRSNAAMIAERIREAIEHTQLEHEGETLKVTASIGGAYARSVGCVESIVADLISRADAQLYRAKREGRNRTLVDAADLPSPFAADLMTGNPTHHPSSASL
ncbi:MAG: GGDEF domain-containing protein [Planctomycetales bacterium]|nr:GGDEF domain-containing protein [Planctomycetales bacterium]